MREFKTDSVPIPRNPPQFPPGLWRQPVDLEIGAGQGLHAIRRCEAHPERILLAVERTTTRFAKLKLRRERHPNLQNLLIFNADAISFVAHFVPDHSLGNVFLFYPNPYPKNRQANLRWPRSPFMSHLLTKLRPGGLIHLATNESFYAEDARTALTQLHGLELVQDEIRNASSEGRTHFEIKYLSRGETCFDLVFKRGFQ